MQTQDKFALARAVTDDQSARMLFPDNSASHYVPLDEVVGTGRAYFVTPRRDLLVVDVDLPSDPARSADLLAAFDMLMDAAARHGVAHLAVSSGRPGHRHGYLVAGTGSARNRLHRWCTEHGMDVRTNGIRPPGSPHRSGQGAAWEAGDSVAAAVTVLSSQPSASATNGLAEQLCPLDALRGRMRIAVLQGHAAAGYESESNARMALAVFLRSSGKTSDQLEKILGNPAHVLGSTFRAKARNWQHDEIERLWRKAGGWISDDRGSSPVALLQDMWAAAGAWPWRGSSGGSDLAVLEELIRTGMAVPTTVVGQSLGSIALGAGISIDTARAALLRLAAAGWLTVAHPETASTTRAYALKVPSAQVAPNRPVPARMSLGDLGADLARWRGLGKVTMRLARALHGSPPRTVPDLGAELSMTPATVRYHLRKLHRLCLVTHIGDGWSLEPDTGAWPGVAHVLGVAGTGQAQREVLKEQRAVRAATRARWEATWRGQDRSLGQTRQWGRPLSDPAIRTPGQPYRAR